eukprot:7886224-Pyramimonas_sp.AAC.1
MPRPPRLSRAAAAWGPACRAPRCIGLRRLRARGVAPCEDGAGQRESKFAVVPSRSSGCLAARSA